LAEIFMDLGGVDLGVSSEAARAGDIKQSYADISKAEKVLGYHPKVCLRDGLRDLLFEKNAVSR
jgi:nucleoside-diphosphate-sugar epimerase